MENFKRIKTTIIVALVIIEGFVWTVSSPVSAWSLGIIGGADGPTAIFISDDEKDNKDLEREVLLEEQRAEEAEELAKEEERKAQEATQKSQEADMKNIRIISSEEADAEGLLILVNKQNKVSEDYVPKDLEEIKYYASDRVASSRYMKAEAADAFHKLVEAAMKEDLDLLMTTAYRSYDFQKTLYDNYVKNEGQEAADTFSAKPGQSEHQTGLSVDVSSSSVDYKLTSLFGQTEEGKWLAHNAHKYGFIIRFPEGKENITGYMYEPWHIRYVGLQVANEIFRQGVTLEEYLNHTNE